MTTILKTVAAVALMAGALVACQKKSIPAPDEKGVCYHAVPQKDGAIKFNKLASNVANMETCAATLEGMRLRFLRLGSAQTEITGAYQGNYLFLQKEGVFMSRSLTTSPFLALMRTGDGRLAIPGAFKQDPANPPTMEPETEAPK